MIAEFIRRAVTRFGAACVVCGLIAGCGGSRASGPPPLDAAKAKQENEAEFRRAMEQVDADPSLSAEEKQKYKRELEHSMKMQSREIDSLDRAQRGLDAGDAQKQ